MSREQLIDEMEKIYHAHYRWDKYTDKQIWAMHQRMMSAKKPAQKLPDSKAEKKQDFTQLSLDDSVNDEELNEAAEVEISSFDKVRQLIDTLSDKKEN